jgi:hypothetical protein
VSGGIAGQNDQIMPIIAHYHCPRCGELFTPLMRIEWASVAPCHA